MDGQHSWGEPCSSIAFWLGSSSPCLSTATKRPYGQPLQRSGPQGPYEPSTVVDTSVWHCLLAVEWMIGVSLMLCVLIWRSSAEVWTRAICNQNWRGEASIAVIVLCAHTLKGGCTKKRCPTRNFWAAICLRASEKVWRFWVHIVGEIPWDTGAVPSGPHITNIRFVNHTSMTHYYVKSIQCMCPSIRTPMSKNMYELPHTHPYESYTGFTQVHKTSYSYHTHIHVPRHHILLCMLHKLTRHVTSNMLEEILNFSILK